MYGGAAAGGKTDALEVCDLRWADHPLHRSVYLRRTRPQLQEAIDRALYLYPQIVPGIVWQEGKSRFECPSGAIYQFGHAEHEQDILNYKCLTPEHEVLTPDGWCRLDDIGVDELVLTPAGFEPVQAVHRYTYSGELVTSTGAISFRATPNHRMPTAYRREYTWRDREAKDLHRGHVVPTEVAAVGSEGTAFDELMGWLISEGGGKIGRAHTICQMKPEGREAIEAACREAGVRFRIDEKMFLVWFEEPHWNTRSENAVDGVQRYDVPDFGAYADEKFIPKSLPKTQRLLAGLLGGDGCNYGSRWIYTTCSAQLADDVQELAICLGYTARKMQYGPRHWQVSIFSPTGGARSVTLGREQYVGEVFCLSVPSTYFVVRHGGAVHVTGNSFEYNVVKFDELTSFTEKQYLFMFMRNRSKSKDLPLWIRSATNPGDVGHEFVYNRFIHKREPYKVYLSEIPSDDGSKIITQQFIPSFIWDNPMVPNRDEYIAGLMQMGEEDVAAYLYGQWTKLAGAMFKVMPIEVPARVYRPDHYTVRCVDYGWQDYSAVYWLVVYDNGAFIDIVSEIYINQSGPERIAQLIKAEEEKLAMLGVRAPAISVGSPEMGKTEGTSGQSLSSMFSLHGTPVTPSKGAMGSRKTGWAQLQRFLQAGRMRYWPGACPNFLRTLPLMMRDPAKPDDIRAKQEDHACDAVRYGLMSIFDPIEIPKLDIDPRVDNANFDTRFEKRIAELQKAKGQGLGSFFG